MPVSPRQVTHGICLFLLCIHSLNGIYFYCVGDAALEATFHTVYSEIVCNNIAYIGMNITYAYSGRELAISTR